MVRGSPDPSVWIALGKSSFIFRLFTVLVLGATMAALNNFSSDLSPMDSKISLFKQGWCDGGGILVVDVCPQDPPLRRRSLRRRRGTWEVVKERMQIVICIDGI